MGYLDNKKKKDCKKDDYEKIGSIIDWYWGVDSLVIGWYWGKFGLVID